MLFVRYVNIIVVVFVVIVFALKILEIVSFRDAIEYKLQNLEDKCKCEMLFKQLNSKCMTRCQWKNCIY